MLSYKAVKLNFTHQAHIHTMFSFFTKWPSHHSCMELWQSVSQNSGHLKMGWF